MSFLESFLRSIEEERAVRVARILKPRIRGRTLDVGCWNGEVAARLEHAPIVGLDVVRPPRPRLPVHLFDGVRIPFRSGAFETVVCSTSLHHSSDPPALLEEMKRVGRGIVVLEDAYDCWRDRLSVVLLHALGSLFVPIPFRVGGFRSSRSWRRLFEEHGLSVSVFSRHPGIQPRWLFLRNDLYVLEWGSDPRQDPGRTARP